MNTGIQDGVSLAATLVDAVEDKDGRVAQWAAERHRVAAEVVRLTDRMTRIATITSPWGRAVRNTIVEFAGHLPQVRTSLARTLAELNA